jgi:hypothetical protein
MSTPNRPPQNNQVAPLLPFRTPAQATAIIGLAVVVALLIGALYLAQATVTATTGSQLLELQRTRDFLQRANSDLEARTALRSNLNTLRGRAQELGFRPARPDDLIYLVVAGYSPIRATPTPIFTATPSRLYDETFSGWLGEQWQIISRQFEAWMQGG